MYRFVDALGPETGTVTLNSQDLSAPSLIEDVAGDRLILLPSIEHKISDGYVERAVDHGAAYVLAPDGEGWQAHLMGDDPVSFTEPPMRSDLRARAAADKPAEETFVHLHTHTDYSPLDGYSTVEQAVDVVVAHGQKALGVADHGYVSAHPELYNRCMDAGIKPVLGIEAYLQEDRHRRTRSWYVKVDKTTGAEYEVDTSDYDAKRIKAEGLERRSDSAEARWGYQHITLWAMNDVGLRNIWAMSTVSFREGLFDGKPRVDYELLERFSEGVIASTGCLRGPLARAILDGDEQRLLRDVGRLMEIYQDRLYVEIHTNSLEDQRKVNLRAVEVARDYGLPMIGAVDAHYAHSDDAPMHQAWLAMTTNKDGNSESGMFTGDGDYYLMSEAEVREALAYLGEDVVEECVQNTAALAARCDAKVVGESHPPIYSRPSAEHPDPALRDAERLIEKCMEGWWKVEQKVEAGIYTMETAEARLEMEVDLIVRKDFPGYYLVVEDYVTWVREDLKGLVGPGRGSGAGSLVAYLLGITGIDPIEHGLIFERFINEGRKGLPDFDVDFQTIHREPIKNYLIQRWGEDYTLSIGTNLTVKPKKAADKALSILRDMDGVKVPEWSDVTAFKAAVVESNAAAAGTEVSWEEFAADHEELVDRLDEQYPEFMALVEGFVGRVYSYGKHAAGMVVSTENPLTDLPMRVDDKGHLISQFDMNALEALGYVKFDILTIRNLDTIAETIDRVQKETGVVVDPERWIEEYNDPQVWAEIAAGNTLGMFQIETSAGTRVAKAVAPRNIAELAAAVSLNRPGPLRSGVTDTYLRRKHGQEPVTAIDDRLTTALADTFAVPIYQEQIMTICRVIAGYSLAEADDVRRILGKKKRDLVEAEGRKFIPAAVENGMARKDAERLWEQITEYAKYVFNLSHAAGYALIGMWTAWLKVHYPRQFIPAILSGIKDERVPELIADARRMGYSVAGPDVNESEVFFSAKGITVRYGLANVPGVGEGTARQIVEGRPYTSVEDFRERLLVTGSAVNAGHLRALAKIGAFDSIEPHRRALVLRLEDEASGAAKRCIFKDETVLGPNGLPCTFDWDNEPDPPMQSKGRGKKKVFFPKPPPARCTIACRNFTPPPPLDPEEIEPYGDADIRGIEYEVLGTYVSSTPFDRIDPEVREQLDTPADINSGGINREYTMAAVVESARTKDDRTGRRMAFVTLNGEGGNIDAVVFGSIYPDVKRHLEVGRLVFVALYKTDRGVQVQEIFAP